MNSNVSVSICIPTYNQAAYVEQAVRSAAQQSYPPVEIIIADDCSTDNTLEVLQKLAKELTLIKILKQPHNKGITKNTNECLKAASGDFIIRLDSDDFLSKDYTYKLVETLVQNPEAAYAHAGVQEIDQNGNYLKKRLLARKTGYQSSDKALREAVTGYRVAANILMFRRTALEFVGFMTSAINFAEDYHLSASLAAAGFGNTYLNEILSFYRVWVDVGKRRQRRKLAEIMGLRAVFEDVIEPAYLQRGWNMSDPQKSKTGLACEHADCLGWSVYSEAEKAELLLELNKLSASGKLRMYEWVYLNGLGGAVDFYRKMVRQFKAATKSVKSGLGL